MKILAVDDKKLTLEALEDAIKKAEPCAKLGEKVERRWASDE